VSRVRELEYLSADESLRELEVPRMSLLFSNPELRKLEYLSADKSRLLELEYLSVDESRRELPR
jgi:hypothetical protein